MKPIPSEPCKRVRVQYNGESLYFTIGDRRVMAHFANESAIKNATEKEFLNLTCRLVSKLRAKGELWATILKQFHDVSLGHRTLVREVERAIRQVIEV